jgi:hypothetical protein
MRVQATAFVSEGINCFNMVSLFSFQHKESCAWYVLKTRLRRSTSSLSSQRHGVERGNNLLERRALFRIFLEARSYQRLQRRRAPFGYFGPLVAIEHSERTLDGRHFVVWALLGE